jgi:PBP1b-binding outer membrane lipoprotein LpoB
MKTYIVITIALLAIFISGCGGAVQTARTPSDTLRALHEASKKKDADAIKKLLSKGTLALLEKNASIQKTTSNDLLTRENGAPFRELPDIRGEKTDGDTATVEVKSATMSENEKIPLVKEDGEWKVALDKYAEDARKRFTEDMNKDPNPESNKPANKQ